MDADGRLRGIEGMRDSGVALVAGSRSHIQGKSSLAPCDWASTLSCGYPFNCGTHKPELGRSLIPISLGGGGHQRGIDAGAPITVPSIWGGGRGGYGGDRQIQPPMVLPTAFQLTRFPLIFKR
jgi:hypothetical protein